MVEFKFELSHILKDLSPNQVGTIKGSIIAKADKIDVQAAMTFIEEKEQDGLITQEVATELGKLLKYYSLYR